MMVHWCYDQICIYFLLFCLLLDEVCSCGINNPCTVTLPDPRDTTGVNFNPAPTCSGTSCSFPSGTTTTVDVGTSQTCRTTLSGSFSVRGTDVVAAFTNDPFLTRIQGNCIGFESDAWWGTGGFQRGVDIQPTSMSFTCTNGELTGAFQGDRQTFRRVNNLLIDGTLSGGITSIQCGACSQFTAADTISFQINGAGGAFTLGGTAGVCNGAGACTLTSAQNLVVTYVAGQCPNNVARVVGRNLYGDTGSNGESYPTAAFQQLYGFHGTCFTLDFSNTGANANGFTILNPTNPFTVDNQQGLLVITVSGDLTVGGDGPATQTTLFEIGGVETIECGTCDALVNNASA